ncbi:hypothetical protein JRO89_XS12G0119800 [Xanthoceras sorbifolium]|uniref:RNase H type-1 domain-containing protein n=1 Tax=Xanthoceras sorbifolium TaxID=99658 RepID=A0ABQ8HCD4_9ROSI|nr:hypothetical protein JRO89_XS12G0119800 [Xanthoceras sorbifolium]
MVAASNLIGADVNIAKAKALSEGILLAANKSLFPLCVESYALNVVDICCGKSISMSDIDNVVADIRAFLGLYDIVSLSHIPRVCNSLAHGIAKQALDSHVNSDWLNCFPN